MPKVISNIKQDIINTAVEVIREEGYKKFNIRHIADKCNIGLGTIYNYYESKEDIMNEIVHNKAEELVVKLEREVVKFDSVREKACYMFNMLKTFFCTIDKEFLNNLTYIIWFESLSKVDESQNSKCQYRVRLTNIIRNELKIKSDFAIYIIIQLFIMCSQKKDLEFDELWSFVEKHVDE